MDDDKEYSYPMRSKEDAQDYRYFPEPDLTPIVISDEWLDEIRSRQPEFRDENRHVTKNSSDFLNMTSISLQKIRHLLISLNPVLNLVQQPKKYPTGSWETLCVS